MGMIPVTPGQELAPGAELWIASSPESSTWALQIDWILNFQVLRASRHESVKLSPQVTEFLERGGLKSPLQKIPVSAPLLIPADLNLPCRWLLSPQDWSPAALAAQWRELGGPSLRIFLPKNEKAEKFAKAWTEHAGSGDFQVVVE